MKTSEFWHILDAVHSESCGNMDRKCELLKARLAALEPQSLTDFIGHFDAVDAAAYTWPLWGAAYVMHGGCSDDSFSDFRATLISHGQATYERALADPESLVELQFDSEEDICYEGFQYVASEVAEAKLREIPKSTVTFPDEPIGEEWDEDSLTKRYPKLSLKYANGSIPQEPQSAPKPWWKVW